ncbi:MAG: hypothetical protein ACRCTW_10075 [Lactococcus garvieae]
MSEKTGHCLKHRGMTATEGGVAGGIPDSINTAKNRKKNLILGYWWSSGTD